MTVFDGRNKCQCHWSCDLDTNKPALQRSWKRVFYVEDQIKSEVHLDGSKKSSHVTGLGKAEKNVTQNNKALRIGIWFWRIHVSASSLTNYIVVVFCMFLLDRRSALKHNIYVPALKSNSTLYCLSNPIGISDKFRSELHFWIGFEQVHQNIYPMITVPIILGGSGRHSGSIGEDKTQVTV